MLKCFDGVKTVSRDGSTFYRKAIASALPRAIQISDRFHLVKNLIEAAQADLSTIIPTVITEKHPKANAIGVYGKMTFHERDKLEN